MKALITTVPFGDKNSLPLELLENAGIEYVINPINMKLTEDQLVEIMSKMKNSVIDQVKELMIYNEIELEFSNTYYIDVAKRASSTGMGARAVKSIVENSLFYLMYNAPELQEDNVIKVIFDKYPSRIEKPMAVYANGESKHIEDYRFFRSNTLDTAK